MEQWQAILDLVKERSLLPFFDSAYQGFASGSLDEDAAPVRLFADAGIELFMAQVLHLLGDLHPAKSQEKLLCETFKDVSSPTLHEVYEAPYTTACTWQRGIATVSHVPVRSYLSRGGHVLTRDVPLARSRTARTWACTRSASAPSPTSVSTLRPPRRRAVSLQRLRICCWAAPVRSDARPWGCVRGLSGRRCPLRRCSASASGLPVRSTGAFLFVLGNPSKGFLSARAVSEARLSPAAKIMFRSPSARSCIAVSGRRHASDPAVCLGFVPQQPAGARSTHRVGGRRRRGDLQRVARRDGGHGRPHQGAGLPTRPPLHMMLSRSL